jgi:phage tail sheath protein FI
MPITPKYPGVYIKETPNIEKTITGVSTSVTAFIGRALRGPINEPKIIHSLADYNRIFGKLWKKSNMSYAVYHYFLNEGTDAVIVRVHNGASKASYEMNGATLKLEASNPGVWADKFVVSIDHNVDKEKEAEDKTISNLNIKDQKTGTSEAFLNISTDSDSPRYIERVLESESLLVRVKENVPNGRPPKGVYEYVSGSASDGDPLQDSNISGDPDAKTGVYALDDIDIFNLLCIPPYKTEETTPGAVYTRALEYCKKRRAMLIVDSPKKWTTKDAPLKNDGGIDSDKFNLPRHENAAIFFPRIIAADPEMRNRLREFVSCGAVAGVIARTDSQRGIMKGAEHLANQWKYISVRRMALYIEESLYRGTQWVVFEPNDEPLWSQIRLNVGAFMHGLFRQGAFHGTTPKDAYFVKCDKETTTQYDIDHSIVNIIVGFAPLKPAEFVIIKIQQITGQEAA